MDSRRAAEIISLVFNPPIVAAPTFLALLLLERPRVLVELLVISVAFGAVVPLIVVIYLSSRGIIPDFYASQRETRYVPFIGAILSYLLGSAMLGLLGAPPIITSMMLCYAGNSLMMMVISLKWKISIHATGITGPATALIYTLGVTALPFLLLVVPVGWARLKLKAHTPTQVVAGALLTILTTLIQLGIYMPLL